MATGPPAARIVRERAPAEGEAISGSTQDWRSRRRRRRRAVKAHTRRRAANQRQLSTTACVAGNKGRKTRGSGRTDGAGEGGVQVARRIRSGGEVAGVASGSLSEARSVEPVTTREVIPLPGSGRKHRVAVAAPITSTTMGRVVNHTTRTASGGVAVQADGASRRAIRREVSTVGGAAAAGGEEAVEGGNIHRPGSTNVAADTNGGLALISKGASVRLHGSVASMPPSPAHTDCGDCALDVVIVTIPITRGSSVSDDIL